MPRYIIHIGPHKTGTTYLQAAFQKLRPRLLEKGIWYPEHWQGEDKLGHHRLARQLRNGADDGLAGEFRRLGGEAYHTVLISAEDLADLKDDSLASFRSLLADAEARIVFYCRRWSEVLPSGWQETVKQGHTTTFPEFFANHMRDPLATNMNCEHTLRRYAEHFGTTNISLVSYSNILDGGGDLFVHFCQSFLAWPDPPKPDLGRLNASLNPIDVEVIRVLNAIDKAAGGIASSALCMSYLRTKAALDLSNLSELIKSHMGHLRVNDGSTPLQRMHEKLFEQFGSLLVEPRSGSRLFTPRSADIPYVRQDYLLSGDCAATLGKLYQTIRGAGPAPPPEVVPRPASREPLLVFADALYRDETVLANRTAALERFLSQAPMNHDLAQTLLEQQAQTDRYAKFHMARFLDQLRAFSALAKQQPEPIKLLDVGVAPITPMYHEFAAVEVTTAGLPWPTPAAQIARRFGSVAHHYVDFDTELLSEKQPDLIGRFDIVTFCEVIAHVRADPTEQLADLLALLRPGGHMIISTPNAFSRAWVARLLTGRLLGTLYQREKMRDGKSHDFRVRDYTPTELHEAITAAGAEVVHEGLFDWYGPAAGEDFPHQVSGRAAMMFIARKPDREGWQTAHR